MAPQAVHERAVRIAGVRSDPTADKLAISGALTDARHNRAWLDDRAVATLFAEHTPSCVRPTRSRNSSFSVHMRSLG